MSIVCPACKQENTGKDPAYCSYCYHPFKGSKPLEQPVEDEPFDLRNMAHPARHSFSPLTKRYDLTRPVKAFLGVAVMLFAGWALYNFANGGFYYEEDVYEENGGTVHVHHFHILPKHNGKGANSKPAASARPSAAPASN